MFYRQFLVAFWLALVCIVSGAFAAPFRNYPRGTSATMNANAILADAIMKDAVVFEDGVFRVTLAQAANGLCDDKSFDENPPDPLPPNASELERLWQPSVDFDTDSCYNVPAIGPDGHVDQGRSRHETNTENCRDEYDMDHSNVYVRSLCSNDWCAFVYDYFWEKDIGDRICIGHQFDWEHIIVWTKSGKPRFASVSAHGGYNTRFWEDIPIDNGTHVKAVYNKDGLIGTHYFRWSMGEGDEPPENHKGVWWRSDLVSWEGFPSLELRNNLTSYDFGDASMAIRDDYLMWNLERSVNPIWGKLDGFDFDFNMKVTNATRAM